MEDALNWRILAYDCTTSVDGNGVERQLPYEIEEIFIVCVIVYVLHLKSCTHYRKSIAVELRVAIALMASF